jgi:hypothetical protein
MEVGSQATPFEHRSFGEELALCQRYYTVIADGAVSTSDTFGLGVMYGTTVMYSSLRMPTEMRASPSSESTDIANSMTFYRAGAADHFDEAALSISTPSSVEFFNQTDISGTSGQAGFLRINNNSSVKFALSAEL